MSPEFREPIVVPQYIQESLALEAARIAEADRLTSLEAARNIIDVVPGVEVQPATETVKPGKFGRGVVETAMPADPSHVIGWDGIVRR